MKKETEKRKKAEKEEIKHKKENIRKIEKKGKRN